MIELKDHAFRNHRAGPIYFAEFRAREGVDACVWWCQCRNAKCADAFYVACVFPDGTKALEADQAARYALRRCFRSDLPVKRWTLTAQSLTECRAEAADEVQRRILTLDEGRGVKRSSGIVLP